MCLTYLKRGWRYYRRSIEAFVIAELLVLFLLFIMGVLVLLNPIFLQSFLTGKPSSIDLASVLVLVLLVILSSLFQFGIYGIVFESTRRRARVGTMFKTIKAYWTGWLGISVLISFVLLPLVFFFTYSLATFNLPGIIVSAIVLLFLSLLFLLAYPALIDVKSTKKALQLSARIALSNFLELLALFLFFAGVSFLVALIPLFGYFINTLVISPIGYATYVSFYKAKKRRS